MLNHEECSSTRLYPLITAHASVDPMNRCRFREHRRVALPRTVAPFGLAPICHYIGPFTVYRLSPKNDYHIYVYIYIIKNENI